MIMVVPPKVILSVEVGGMRKIAKAITMIAEIKQEWLT